MFSKAVNCLLALAALASARFNRAPPQYPTRQVSDTNQTYPSYRISPLDGSIIALPTQDQLAFQDKEMGMLIHFEVATYISIDGCNGVPGLVPDPDLFDPTLLNTDQWLDVITSTSAKYATLVAKHNCGFTTWPSAVTFETRDNTTSPYNYSVAYSPVNGTDVVKLFSDSADKYGIGHGFYYSTIVNNFLNVQNSLVNATWSPGEIRITNETYDEIVIAQLTELWTTYGEGKLTEVRPHVYCSRIILRLLLTRGRSCGLMEATVPARWTRSKPCCRSINRRRAFSTRAIPMALASQPTPSAGSAQKVSLDHIK